MDFKTRIFNRLEVQQEIGQITKYSKKTAKIIAEYEWYLNAPESIKKHLPEVGSMLKFGEEQCYQMSLINGNNLSLQYINNPEDPMWEGIFFKIWKMFTVFSTNKLQMSKAQFTNLTFTKLMSRLSEPKNEQISRILVSNKCNINGIQFNDFNRLFLMLADETVGMSETNYGCYGHGDLCFSNIILGNDWNLYCVDPRGDQLTDIRYDFAKMRHSLLGYDHITNKQYSLTENENGFTLNVLLNKHHLSIAKSWDESIEKLMPFKLRDIKVIEAMLWLSMIPLHEEDKERQLAFFLYGMLKLEELNNERIEKNSNGPRPHLDND